jgi:hypothetical protein
MLLQEFVGPASGVPFYGAPQMPALAQQAIVTEDNASVRSAAFNARTGLIRVDPAGEAIHIAVGGPTIEATGTDFRIPADAQPVLLLVSPGQFLAVYKQGPV